MVVVIVVDLSAYTKVYHRLNKDNISRSTVDAVICYEAVALRHMPKVSFNMNSS